MLRMTGAEFLSLPGELHFSWKAQVSLYTKLKTRTLVMSVKVYSIDDPWPAITPDVTYDVRTTKTLFMVFADGHQATKHDGVWGYVPARAIDNRFRPFEFLRKDHYLHAIRASIDFFWIDFKGKDYPHDTLTELLKVWADGNGIYSNLSERNHNFILIQDIWGKKKKPTWNFSDRRDILTTAASALDSKKKRSVFMQMVNSDNEWLTESYEMAERYEMLKVADLGKALDAVISVGPINKAYVRYINNLYRMFPGCKLITLGEVFDPDDELVKKRQILSMVRDTMELVRFMTKKERSLVKGRTLSSLHESATLVFNTITMPRRTSKIKGVNTWEPKDELLALENEDFMLAHPRDLPGIGYQMHHCVGCYIDQVLLNSTAILVDRVTGHQVCLEVHVYDRGTVVLQQAKLAYNKKVLTDEVMVEKLRKWLEEKQVTVGYMGASDTGLERTDPAIVIDVP